MRFDLNGVGVEVQPERFDERLSYLRPSHVRVSREMGVVVTHRAVDFAERFDRGELCRDAAQAEGDVRQFFAECGWASGLAMGARQHGQRRVLLR